MAAKGGGLVLNFFRNCCWVLGTLDLDGDAEGRIEHEAGQSVSVGELVDPRTEAHPLHDSLDKESSTQDSR
jgi:hypothetical protein